MRDQEIIGLYEAYASIYAQEEEVEILDEGEKPFPHEKVERKQVSLRGKGGDALERRMKMGSARRRAKEAEKTGGSQQDAGKGWYHAKEEVGQFDEGRNTSLSALSHESQKRKEDKERGRPETKSEIHGRLMLGKFRPGASKEERAEGGRERLRDRGKVPQKGGKDMFEHVLEHLVAEGYADNNEAALAIMANMSEEWKQDIVEAAKDQSNKQIEKGVKTTYKAGNVIDNQHQGRSKGLNKLPAGERRAKTERMRGRLKTRRDDLFGERNRREDEARAEMKKKYGL
jgi:hypothetical protein